MTTPREHSLQYEHAEHAPGWFYQDGHCSCGNPFKTVSVNSAAAARRNLRQQHDKHKSGVPQNGDS